LNHRTKLLLDGKTGQYTPKRHGCRKRKSVRGCILGVDMSCINVSIVKRGPADLPKLTEETAKRPNTRGPKRANNIRKAWGLGKKEDVRMYVVRRTIPGKNGKKDKIKSPKIQRLITPIVKQRRRRMEREYKKSKEKSKKEAADYANLLKQIRVQKRAALLSKKRSEARSKLSVTSEKKSAKVEVDKKAAAATTTTKVKKDTTKALPAKRPLRATGKLGVRKNVGITKPSKLAQKKATEVKKKSTTAKPGSAKISSTTKSVAKPTVAKKIVEKKAAVKPTSAASKIAKPTTAAAKKVTLPTKASTTKPSSGGVTKPAKLAEKKSTETAKAKKQAPVKEEAVKKPVASATTTAKPQAKPTTGGAKKPAAKSTETTKPKATQTKKATK